MTVSPIPATSRLATAAAAPADPRDDGKNRSVEVPLRIRSSRPLRMQIKPSVDMVSAWIEKHGMWEPYNTVLVRDLLAEGDVMLDVGANLGYFSLVAADRVGVSGQVHAFEPEPENYWFCARNVALNGFEGIVSVHRFGLGDRPDEQPLFRSAFNHGGHQLVVPLPEDADPEGVRVPLTSLDRWVAEHPEVDRIDLIKMDVQGYETRALLGMEEQITRHRDRLTLLMEFSPSLLRAFDADGLGLDRLFAWLDEKAAAIFAVERVQPNPESVSLVPLNAESLASMSDRLCADSAVQGMDLCIDLLVLFSAAGVDRLGRRLG